MLLSSFWITLVLYAFLMLLFVYLIVSLYAEENHVVGTLHNFHVFDLASRCVMI